MENSQLAHAVDEMAESLKRLVTEYKYAEAEIRQLNETLEQRAYSAIRGCK